MEYLPGGHVGGVKQKKGKSPFQDMRSVFLVLEKERTTVRVTGIVAFLAGQVTFKLTFPIGNVQTSQLICN